MVKYLLDDQKAQMKIQQTAFVLIAVTMFFALIGMFFLNMKLSKMEEVASELKDRKAQDMVSKLANSPEFSCGSSFEGEIIGNCVDFDKVMALKKNINDYEDMWGVEGIELRKIYPKESAGDIIECTNENYPECNKITLIESDRTGKENFVTLCRKADLGYYTQSKCEIGKLIISYKKIG